MTFRIIDRHRGFGIDRRSIRRLVSAILADHDRREADLTIVFTDDAFVRTLNREYRDVDRATDVLSFSMEEGDAAGAPPADEGVEDLLGDVVISADRAAVQARRYRRPVDHEILKLVAHGVLHLLGHDHTRAPERLAMRKLENDYVRRIRAARRHGTREADRRGGRGAST